jgi:RHS repeat-associated protein
MFSSTKNTTPFWFSTNSKFEEKSSHPFGSYPKPQISDLVVLAAYPFGSILSSVSKGVYRYGFNGKETDSETDLQDYGERIYNSSIAKFLSADPLIVKGKQYPWYSPYHFAGNTPISAVDLDGLEDKIVTHYFDNIGGKHQTHVKIPKKVGPKGYGTLHLFIKHDLVETSRQTTAGGYSYSNWEVKDFKYKQDKWEPTPIPEKVGNKLNEAHQSIVDFGNLMKSGGVGFQGKATLGIFSLSGSVDLFGNSENSGGINFQLDFNITGSGTLSNGGIKTTFNDWMRVGATVQPYVFLSDNKLKSTDGLDRKVKDLSEGSLKASSLGKGIGMSISKDLNTGDTKYKIGPEFGVTIDLSKKENKGSNKVGLSGGVSRNYRAQYTSKETSTQR